MPFTRFSTILALVIASPAFAGSSLFQPKGFIQNDQGEQCWYHQEVVEGSHYFHDGVTANIGVLTFDDQSCMQASEFGQTVNKMMINNVISRWYSRGDANFQTRESELFPTSLLQKRGQCIQSKKYPATGIVVDYEESQESIVRVRHGMSAQGCKK
ncbi:hypothetical protein [Marinobacter alkaliphilus]|uniref:hypothetical protein n=1 Tax=Marinobacter alkaliphilus TaxID=254719 RepID=UPI003D7669E8